MNKRVELKIYGRVQGVFFRDSTQRKAKKLKLTGYVQNQEDGSVKVVAEGEESNLKELVNWCYNGPIIAKVKKVEKKWRESSEKFKNFKIRY